MGREVVYDSTTLVSPGTCDVPGGSVAIKQPAVIDLAHHARAKLLLEADYQRLETVVVARSPDGRMTPSVLLQGLELPEIGKQRGLLHQDVLAETQEPIEQLELGFIRHGQD